MATGLVFQEIYLWHNTWNWATVFPPGLTVQPGEHAENPETKRRFKNLLDVTGMTERLTPIRPRAATEDELARFHTRAHIDHIKALSAGQGGESGELTPMGTGSYEIAALAVGGTMAAIDAVVEGRVANAYALVRPPGHHALADKAMGFCLFGNVAVAVKHAMATHGLGRVAVVDWDVHHGNGTQAAFYDDPSVLTISLHQEDLYPPASGRREENGAGAGLGANLNAPLPPGSGDGAYVAAFERVVLPALDRFRPDLIVVASGLDASGLDPLGRMMVSARGYRRLTEIMMAAADRLCGGRLVLSHEGGYSAMYVPYCGLAIMEALAGLPASELDPWDPIIQNWGGQALQPHQAQAIDAATALVDRVPRP
ncbi:MAG: class II histone deacetylase [Rhodobacteraceae bacterium]|nr:MAG: class II histone deacetylase [Paracoccaceae bacterium]